MDDNQRYLLGNYCLLIFAILYGTSLVNVAMTSLNNSFIGWEVLLVGGFQTIVGFHGIAMAIKELSLETFLVYLPISLPWLANISVFISGISILKFSLKLGRFFALTSALFAGVFFISPKAMIDNGASLAIVQPQIGAYLWGCSTVILLLASLIKVMPNKKLQNTQAIKTPELIN